MSNFITLTKENIESEHLCCIIRQKKPHPGVESKRAWLKERITEGHVFRKLDTKGCCFIEYAPLDTAWVPIVGENYYYIYCLWVTGDCKGHGYGRELMESCIADARAHGMSGVCMLGAKRQKNWLSDQSFAEKFGFRSVDQTADGYLLLALSFDETEPRFTECARAQSIEDKELTVYYSMQCPFVYGKIEDIKNWAEKTGTMVQLRPVDTLEKAKNLPCVFNNFGVFYNGRFLDVNLLDIKSIEKAMQKT